jgi:hypothetical protein
MCRTGSVFARTSTSVEELLDGADEEVAYGDAEVTDEVVLAPFLVVLVVVPQGCQLAAQRADGGEPVRVGRRADPAAVQLQVREPVRDARPDRAGHGQRGEVPVPRMDPGRPLGHPHPPRGVDVLRARHLIWPLHDSRSCHGAAG